MISASPAIGRDVSNEYLNLSPLTSAKFPATSDVQPEEAHLVFEKNVLEITPKDKFRVEYLRKLSDQKVWVPPPQRPPKHQSLIIFDWDDTLMYSSFILQGRRTAVSANTSDHLQSIERAALKLLETALTLGHTFIITNASEGWVEQCVECYMPSLRQIIKKVRIISARTEHEAECNCLSEWKKRAFLELGRQLDKKLITNLVSIGDANYEMEAVELLGKQFPQSLVKTVKLQECPTPEELKKELDLVAPKLKSIVEKAMNMKIRLERRSK